MRTAVLLATAAAALVLAGPAQATFPGKNGKIAFGSATAGLENFETDVIDPDGTGRTTLADPDGPVWSPTGTLLGLLPQQHGCCYYTTSIYTVNADGSALRSLTDPAWDPDYLSWSANGAKLLFAARVCRRCADHVYVMNPDGTGLTQLAEGTLPSWSPGGAQIAYNAGSEIRVMNADGTDSRFIATGVQPKWSPDGARIAFNRDDQIYTILPDGRAERRLAAEGSYVYLLSWSPTGDRLLFIRFETTGAAQTAGLWVIGRDGRGLTQLSTPATGQGVSSAAWSPDGTKVVFSDGEPRAKDLFLVNADGTGTTNLTNTPDLWETDVDWQAIPGPARNDYKNASDFCRAEQTFWGDQFASRYGGAASAFGTCVSRNR